MILGCFSLILAQNEVVGTFKLTGTQVRYTSLLRQTSTLTAHDIYGLGVNQFPLLTFGVNDPAGQILNGPFNEANLALGGAFLNVTFREDGSGQVNQGSFYPTLDLDEETCISAGASLPITDILSSSSTLAPTSYVQTQNYIGLRSMSPLSTINGHNEDGTLCDNWVDSGEVDDDGEPILELDCFSYGPGFAGTISLTQSSELDYFYPGQSAGALGACQAGFSITADGVVPCDPSPGNECDFYEACSSAGYVSQGHDFETIPNNGVRDLYVEWHAVDGELSQSGFGDDVEDPCEDGLCVANLGEPQCQDGDSYHPACTDVVVGGTPLEKFDRILGVPGVPSTFMNPECGFGFNDLVDGECPEGETCFGSYIAGGPEDVVPALMAGVKGACQAGIVTDANENGFPDVVDGCFELHAGGYGVPVDEAATLAFIGACQGLGFDAGSCAQLALAAQFQVVGQSACYNITTHQLVEPNEDGTCDDGFVPYLLEWDCYGLAALTTQSEALCEVAASAWADDCVFKDPVTGDWAGGLSRTFLVVSPELATWGGFLTVNAVTYSGCMTECLYSGADAVTCGTAVCGAYTANDGGWDLDLSNPTAGGRLMMEMDGLCVPTLDIREVYIDFDQIADCEANGDVTMDGNVNVLDIVALVQIVIGAVVVAPEQFCNANFVSDDPVLNVLDIIQLVGAVLADAGREADASMIEIFNNDGTVTIDADGYVGAVQMTLEHGDDFSIEMTEDAYIALAHTDGNETTLMVVNPVKELFTSEDKFTIVSTIAGNSHDYIEVMHPEALSLSEAYPNPFNPTTSVNLQVGTEGHVTVNVYNVMGQLVTKLVDTRMDAGNYNITWDAGNFASGMYVIKAESLNGIASKKVMLVK